MTVADIQKRQDRDAKKFELAKAIRAMFDQARKEYGAGDWDSEGIEDEVIEMVTE